MIAIHTMVDGGFRLRQTHLLGRGIRLRFAKARDLAGNSLIIVADALVGKFTRAATDGAIRGPRDGR